jgi:hypothetical protein
VLDASPPSDESDDGSQSIDSPTNALCLLAELDRSYGNSRAALFPQLRPKLRANTRASNDRDGRASTRRESGRPRVLIVVATAICRDRKAGASKAMTVRGNAQIVAGSLGGMSGAETGILSSE